jgi:hypothetical protein
VYSVTSVLSGVVSYAGDFELDSGQRSTHYQRARLYLKRSSENKTQYASGSNTQFIVAFEYFLHSGLAAAPFIGKHSYVHSETGNIPYSEIPLYTDEKTGVSVSLANCLDFRRNGITSATPTLKPYGVSEMSSLPAYSTTTVSYSHYLPRIDKVCVKADPEDGSALFFSVTGTPDLSPVAPPDPDDALVLATVTVPAYTHNGSDLVITPVAPHNLNVRPIVISDSSVISFEIEGRAENFLCTLDSRFETVTAAHQLAVRRNGFSIRIVRLEDIGFMSTLRAKMLWGEDRRNH